MASSQNPWDPRVDFIYSIDSKKTKEKKKGNGPMQIHSLERLGGPNTTFFFLTSLKSPNSFFFIKTKKKNIIFLIIDHFNPNNKHPSILYSIFQCQKEKKKKKVSFFGSTLRS